ncbi:AAA family ATPase [Xanthobacter sediminis]|uniref:AAA family ATPase n=1 Tax=Xanthobacter sediminis TaxID=3119926 RepID=UPI0037266C72
MGDPSPTAPPGHPPAPAGDAPRLEPRALSRILILGNSGAGKSWLAAHLAARLDLPALDLDLIHWEPGAYGRARERDAARAEVRAAAAGDGWIIEGVYGWLAAVAIPRATAMIWVRPPVEECTGNLRCRGLRRGADTAALDALIGWAGDYDLRTDTSSRAGHATLFEAFNGPRIVLPSRADMEALLASLP